MPPAKDRLSHLLCSNIFSGAAYIFDCPAGSSLADANRLVNDLPQELEQFAVVLPCICLEQGQQEIINHWLIDIGLTAVICLPGQNQVLLIFSRLNLNPFLLFIDASHCQLTGLLLDKIAGAYRRSMPRISAPSENSSPVCYAEQFNHLEAGILIDDLAYLASREEIAGKLFNIHPKHYVI